MALIHDATLTPSKRELMEGWLPSRSWFDGDLSRKPVGSFRFDDPAGEVGIEGFMLGGDGLPTLFLPLTYRAAPLDGASAYLIGTSEHSVLGPRWVYDGCGDPVWATSLATAILTGGTGVDMRMEKDGEWVTFATSASVRGSGSADAPPAVTEVGSHDEGALTVVNAGPLELVVIRVLGTQTQLAETLTATWKEQTGVVAGIRAS